ncbi:MULTISPECIES: hypothetical protein [Streptomyces]|uniref:Transposase IS200 like n=1 Tax=Streptomyces mirabilis TaxID=68239 RepID=A0ABU3V2I1_9ACTN|nr:MULTISPECIES: hypothetical protein [Streptomyces]MCX4615103.1 hypothetical protein [Streptomyces mirabilis]MCX5346227.1 hypothetical protein [Streptomyces mirabilis]MCX5356431.1 hypothetical protein [Streptomyces mirabilis]MDU9000379.1 hypothetical protein [Streptomyces mirabilis]QDN85049.1 hypothetical protein FNV61_04680 [Streptomyces sp. RLB3-6]
MGEMQKIRTGRHCAFMMHVHLVFLTKVRHKVFTDVHLTRMECSYLAGTVGGAPISVVKQYIEQQNRPV